MSRVRPVGWALCGLLCANMAHAQGTDPAVPSSPPSSRLPHWASPAPQLLPSATGLVRGKRLGSPPSAWALGTTALTAGAGTWSVLELVAHQKRVAAYSAETDGAEADRMYTEAVVPGAWRARSALALTAVSAGATAWAWSRVGAKPSGAHTPSGEGRDRAPELPFDGEASAFATGSGWLPAPISGTRSITRGYASAGVRLRMQLFDRVELVRLHAERSVGRPPSQGRLTGADISDNGLAAQIIDSLLSVRLDETKGVGVFIRREHFEQTLILDEPKWVVDSDRSADELAGLAPTPAGSRLRNRVSFTRVDAGMTLSQDIDEMETRSLVGVSALAFRKPWSLDWLDPINGGKYVFESRIWALGVGANAVGRTQPHGLVAGLEYFSGLGSIQLTDEISVEEIAAEQEVLLIAVLVGGELGYRVPVTREGPVRLLLEATGTLHGDWFFLIPASSVESDGEGNGEIDAAEAAANTLTWDVRASGQVRAVLRF